MDEVKTNDGKSSQRVAFVFGASSDIGEAIATEFASAGYRVAISGFSKQRLDDVITRLQNASSAQTKYDRFLALEANFDDLNQVESLIDKVVNKFERLDVLVNNACYLGQSLDLTDESFCKDFQGILWANLMVAVRLAQLAAPHLISSQRGILLNVSTVSDENVNSSLAYRISKAGLSMLTKTLANEFTGTNVRVVAVAPDFITTNDPSGMKLLTRSNTQDRMRLVNELAGVVKFLESEQASYIHGSTIHIDSDYLSRLSARNESRQSKTSIIEIDRNNDAELC